MDTRDLTGLDKSFEPTIISLLCRSRADWLYKRYGIPSHIEFNLSLTDFRVPGLDQSCSRVLEVPSYHHCQWSRDRYTASALSAPPRCKRSQRVCVCRGGQARKKVGIISGNVSSFTPRAHLHTTVEYIKVVYVHCDPSSFLFSLLLLLNQTFYLFYTFIFFVNCTAKLPFVLLVPPRHRYFVCVFLTAYFSLLNA